MNLPEDFNPRRTLKCLNASSDSVYYWEVFFCQGPEIIGDEKEGTVYNLYGKLYMLEVRDDGTRKIYRKENDAWLEVTSGFETFDPDGGHYTMAFDQSAQYVGAAEYSGEIRVKAVGSLGTDTFTFPGVNPILLSDTTINGDVSNSDVVCFYQKPDDLSKIYTRIQREDYDTERLLITHTEEILIDRVTPTFLRYAILATNKYGEKFTSSGELLSFVSELYPLYLSFVSAFNSSFASSALDGIAEQYALDINLINFASSFSDAVVDSTVIDYITSIYINLGSVFQDATIDSILISYIVSLALVNLSVSFSNATASTIAEQYAPLLPALQLTSAFQNVTITTA